MLLVEYRSKPLTSLSDERWSKKVGDESITKHLFVWHLCMQQIKYFNSELYYLNTTPVIMLVILRLRSFLISLNWSLIAGFGCEDSATESKALHVPRKSGLKRPQSTRLQTNGLYFKIIRSYMVQHQLSKPIKKTPGSAPVNNN